MTPVSDFLQIELSPAGVALAGKDGAVRITNSQLSYQVAAGKPVRVLTSEWSRTLSKESYQGQPIFQLSPAPAPAAKAAPAQAPSSQSDSAQEGKK